jgi:hypothetical protein
VHNWKNGYRNIPHSVRQALENINSEFVVVAVAKRISREDIENGIYSHVGLTVQNGDISGNGPVLPPPDAGKWSRRNIDGWDRKRVDWPKVSKTYTFEAPNFGDGARNGYTMHSRTQEVYQHQIFEPQGMTIEPLLLEQRGPHDVVIKFELTPILNRNDPEFELMLLWSINVLQENVGAVSVFSSDATREEYASTIQLDWLLFPPGNPEEVVATLKRHSRPQNSADFERHAADRVRIFERFQPLNYLRGQGGLSSYFGAQFAEDFVVFENLRYGNAVYLLYQNWEEISQRSRLELLKDQDAHFDRVVHTEGWEDRLMALLHDKLFERGLRRRRSGYRARRGT